MAKWRDMVTKIRVNIVSSKLPSHYLNQCCQTISKLSWHSHSANLTEKTHNINLLDKFENNMFKFTAISPRSQLDKLGTNLSTATKSHPGSRFMEAQLTFNGPLTHVISSLEPRPNGQHFNRRHFQTYFLQWKCFNFEHHFTKVCS